MTDEKSIQSLGGDARKKALTPEERKEIARTAALSRWQGLETLPRASHDGDLNLAGHPIKAAVLPNGKRLLTQGTFLLAIGRSRTPKAGTGALVSVDGLPFFLQAEQLKPFISDELRESTTPIVFRLKDGRKAVGYDANLLPMVCEVYLRLRDACLEEGKQPPKQYHHIIEACDLLMRALAHVGITALVDEATGFQEVRDRMALQKILEKYISDEWARWTRRFPPEFYKELFRLKNIPFPPSEGTKKPSYVGHWTNDVVYSRLAPGVLAKLREVNPRMESGYRSRKHHQHLTEDFGVSELKQHLSNVTFLMKTCGTWEEFKERLDVAAPKVGTTMSLPLTTEKH